MADPIKVIEVKESVFANNGRAADALRERMREAGTFMINLMSSPGAGKTTLLTATVKALADEMSIAIMEADVDSDVDAYTVQKAGAKAIQLHTGGMCHLDAAMTEQGLNQMGYEDTDLVVIENVGNLICPAEFDTGAARKVMILSVPEGDDKPLKYPLMFEVSDIVLISKVDTLPYFDFDKERLERNVRLRNPDAKIIYLSAKTGKGMDEWLEWLRDEVAAWKRR
ncbi:MAG: hydrogenase nickel incorporation protein HypB [Olsenella sp.]|nr:hydrogenase nickel incorporation protein HypB [Olsenella sp.]